MMNRISGIVLLAALATAGCSTSPDVESPDDTPDIIEPACLGGRPTAEFRDLSVTPGGVGECTHSPGVTGTPVAISPGGWLIQTSPDIGCTDMDATRLTWLKQDGSTTVLLEDEIFTMAQERTLPQLFAVMDNGFVLYEVSCTEWHCYDGVWTGNFPKLTARDWNNNVLWTVSAADLGGANGAKLIAVDGDGLWVGLTTVTEDRAATSSIARIAGNDGTVSVFGIPVDGALLSAVAGDDGLLALVEYNRIVDDPITADSKRIRTLTAVHIGYDGIAGSATEVFSIDSTLVLEPDVDFKVTVFKTGLLAGMNETDSEFGEPLSYGDAFINHDGTIRWQHTGQWPYRVATEVGYSNERADGSIQIVSADLSRYMVIDADGQSMTTKTMPSDNPLGDGREWFLRDLHFLEDGVLFMGVINAEPGYYDAVVTMYEPGFTSIRWARRYGESCSNVPRVVPSGDGWMVYCPHAVDWPAGEPAYGPMAGQAGTYLYFDGVCE